MEAVADGCLFDCSTRKALWISFQSGYVCFISRGKEYWCDKMLSSGKRRLCLLIGGFTGIRWSLNWCRTVSY